MPATLLLWLLVGVLVTACGGGGGGGGGGASVVSPPTVPQNVAAVAVSPTQVNLSWDPSTAAAGGTVASYHVFRDSVLVATVSATTYSDTGLTADTTYSYQVSAVDAANRESGLSSPATTVMTPPATGPTSPPPDTSAPTVPQNLSASAASPTQVNVSWSASTDVGSGVVAGYNVYRDGVFVGSSTTTGYSDSGLTPTTAYSYTVSAFDNAAPPNESAQSTPVSVTTPAVLSVTYTFSTASGANDWQPVTDSGIAPSWQVVSVNGGRYEQSVFAADSDVGTPLTGTYHRGTYSYVPSLKGLSDYRVSVHIVPLRDGGHEAFDGNDVGLMFRFQDNNNYYRVAFNARSAYARLEKRVGGTFTTLAENSRGYVDGQAFDLTVNLSGALIEVTRNNDPLFAVRDTALTSGTVGLYTQDAAAFDDVVIENPDPNPTVVVGAPRAHSVQTGAAVSAQAVVTNLPGGGSVEFALDGTGCAAPSQPSAGLYSAACGTAVQGDHTVVATVRNGAGGVLGTDTNVKVGVAGHNYTALGDSITLGTFDNCCDALSQDGRIIGRQGYEARLDDLLSAATGAPTIVYNEGVGGDTTVDALTRVSSIVERHGASDRVLVLLGTNDSAGGTPLTAAQYQSNLQSLVNSLTGAGKTVWVARVPPVLPRSANASRDDLIVQYNLALATNIVNGTSVRLGPDLFTFFYDDNGTAGTGDDNERGSLLFDGTHPNALGYRVMARLWSNTLNPASAAAPFFLDKLCNTQVSSTCSAVTRTLDKQNLLQAGDAYYTDQSFTLSAIPAALADGVWIMTKNAERTVTSSTYLQFTVDRAVTVYVAYDAGASARPSWMSGYTDTGLSVSTSNPGAPTLHVFSQTFGAGTVSLGGAANGVSAPAANYVAIVVP